MKRKNVVSGAMIVAAGVSASTDRVTAAGIEPEPAQLRITESGLSLDMVKLDDDILRLGGAGPHGSAFVGGDQETAGQHDGTWVGGGGLELHEVINPANGKLIRVFFNAEKRAYFNPKTGKQIDPPAWVRKAVER